jgi:hypothetical protein
MKQDIEKKYELFGTTRRMPDGTTVYRIRALRDIPLHLVRAGDFGGWVENESNLSHEGKCWIAENGVVSSKASVSGDALIHDDAWIKGAAKIYEHAEVYGHANVSGTVEVCGMACIFEYANVFSKAWIFGRANVCGHANVSGRATICDDAKVDGHAAVSGDVKICHVMKITGDALIGSPRDYLYVAPVGCHSKNHRISSCDKSITFFRTTTGIGVFHNCFTALLEDFARMVEDLQDEEKYRREYRLLIDLANMRMGA